MRIAFLFTLSLLFSISAISQSSKVEIVKSNHAFTLLKDGEPYYIKGAGAKDHFDLLESSGANSIRIWSTNNGHLLDSAYNHGMTVSLGLYVRPERSGMDYNDEYAVIGQIEQLKQEILKYKDHPALLVWGIGNEVDLRYSNFKVWDTIEELAKFIKEVDPNHPSMTVIAGLDPSKAYLIKERCPSVDILGLNAYGSIENASSYIRKYNWDKPYIVSEWGVNGPFEAPRTAWGAKIEPPGGIKAKTRMRRYKKLIEEDVDLCLGSYCFLWGQKQESTATWHGMFLSDGRPTEAVDFMSYCWKGSWPDSRAPSINSIELDETNWKKDHILNSNSEATLEIKYDDFNNAEVFIDYKLYPEAFTNKIGGDIQDSVSEIEFEITNNLKDGKIIFMTPSKPGAYRIFAIASNSNNQCSVANIAFIVE